MHCLKNYAICQYRDKRLLCFRIFDINRVLRVSRAKRRTSSTSHNVTTCHVVDHASFTTTFYPSRQHYTRCKWLTLSREREATWMTEGKADRRPEEFSLSVSNMEFHYWRNFWHNRQVFQQLLCTLQVRGPRLSTRKTDIRPTKETSFSPGECRIRCV